MGSSVNGTFGEYEPPGFRSSLFSDFDFIFFVKDDYVIPKWLRREPSGKPFSDDGLNLAYRNTKVIDNKYDVEMFFVREKNLRRAEFIEEAENAGIPLTYNTKHQSVIVFSSSHSSPNSA